MINHIDIKHVFKYLFATAENKALANRLTKTKQPLNVSQIKIEKSAKQLLAELENLVPYKKYVFLTEVE